jgi:hypothetical protein
MSERKAKVRLGDEDIPRTTRRNKAKSQGKEGAAVTVAASNLASSCSTLKATYETCFQSWYMFKYTKDPSNVTTLPCTSQFDAYRACVRKDMQQNEVLDDALKLVNEMNGFSETDSNRFK